MVVRDHAEHRIARQQAVAATFVEQIAGTGHGVLEHGEGRLPARPAVPRVAGIRANCRSRCWSAWHADGAAREAAKRSSSRARARQTIEHGVQVPPG